MATTVATATLTVTLTESITLNGSPQGSTNTLSIGSIKEIYKRIVRCIDDNDCTIATFQTATHTADNAIDLEDVRYIRLTNLDASNSINLSLQIEEMIPITRNEVLRPGSGTLPTKDAGKDLVESFKKVIADVKDGVNENAN